MSASGRKLSVFPAFYPVSGRRVLVIGGGAEAAAKVRLLAETEARIEVFAAEPSAELSRDVAAAGGELRERDAGAGDFKQAALAFVATGDETRDRDLWALAREAGVPVNVVDRPELCDFHTPALVNRAPLAIAVGTGGVAPVLARQVRARIETLLAPAFGELAGLAERIRGTVNSALPSSEKRRRFWARFFSGPIAEKVFAGKLIEAQAEAAHAVGDGNRAGHVSLVGAGPGAVDLLTLRAQRVLQEADLIVYDRLVPEAIVAQGRRDAQRIYVGKAKGAHSATQGEINDLIVREARTGKRVVRLKSGDPLIFGRAGEEFDALRAAGISFDIIPGITAAFAAAAETEIPLTLRGVASSLVFVTGHDADGETLPDWAGLALNGTTVAVYMGLSVAAKVATRLIGSGVAASTPIAIVENASLPEQKAFAGRLDELGALAAGGLEGPALFVIGRVVAESRLLRDAAPLTEIAA